MLISDIAHFVRLEETRINGLYPVSAELFFRVHYSGRSKPKLASQGRAWERFKKQCRASDIIEIESGCGNAQPFWVDLEALEEEIKKTLPLENDSDEDKNQAQRKKALE